MMLEEAGYNPFVEGAEVEIKTDPPAENLRTSSYSFIESDFSYVSNGRRLSFVESNSSPFSSSPAGNSSPRNTLTTSSPRTPSRLSPSLKVVLPSSSSSPDLTQDANDLENPFVNESIDLSDEPAGVSSPTSSTSPTLPTSPTMAALQLPQSSPLKSSSDRVSRSAHERRPPSPRLPSSPLASSSTSNELRNSSFLYQQPRSVVTVEKAEWVPDSHSLVCEHCADEFNFIRRRHHCRVCGHLFCGECIVKLTLPSGLAFLTPQKTCVRCAYRVIQVRSKVNFTSTTKRSDDPSLTQKLSGKVQNWMYRMSGMHEDGKLDRFAAKIATPQFSLYQTDVMNLSIPSHHDASTVPATAYIPKGDGPYSVLVYIPGGNFVLKTETGVATFCKELCCKVGCIVISVEYRLAPEFQFPTQWEDSYSVVKWVYDSAVHELPKLEKDPKIAVCGEGAGGLLAAAVCQMARDRGSPPISYQLLLTPWLNLSTLNLDKLVDSYIITKDLMKWVIKQLFKEYADRDKPYVSPLLASSVADLPSTKVITAGHDPLRYDAEEYANEMRKGGASVSVTRYENSMHGFIANYSDSHSELEEAVYECVVCLRETFGRGEPLGANKPSPLTSNNGDPFSPSVATI